MGYSGHIVKLCENGHMEIADTYASFEDPCHTCGTEHVSEAHVNETNCLPYMLDFELHQVTPLIRHHCPVCNKTHEITEETYKMVKVDLWESEDGNYITKKLDPVDRHMCQACSDMCKEYALMKSALLRLWKRYVIEEDKNVTARDLVISSLLNEKFFFCRKMFEDEMKPFEKQKPSVSLTKCCDGGYELRDVVVLGGEVMKFPHCTTCGKMLMATT